MNENDFIRRGAGNPYPAKYSHEYARTKALAEKAVLAANDSSTGSSGLYTTVIAPHQVYGPEDTLFVPNIVSALEAGKLFKFGDGQSIVSFTHVDNVCHALILAANALLDAKIRKVSAGQFYFVTDDKCYNFWDAM